MKEEAVLLADSNDSRNADRIANVLGFFGIAYRVSTLSNLFLENQESGGSSPKMRVFCSSDNLWELIERLERSPEAVRVWRDEIHSVFVYPAADTTLCRKLAKRLMKTEHTPLIQADFEVSQYTVSDKEPRCCGPMSGLRIAIRGNSHDAGIVSYDGIADRSHPTVLGKSNSVFLKTHHQTVPVFLSACQKIINLDDEILEGNFDIRDHFLSATPIVMYVKWAFEGVCWTASEINACLIIDDPLLTPRYGFLNYQNLLQQMERHNFTTNIAFIPWNWRRCNSAVINIFKSHPERYSLSIHGCDHTGGEFGTRDVETLMWKSRQAIDRMSRHELRTSIQHDRIMVFPQGVFSQASLLALKHTGFIAAVNTEVLSTDTNRPAITISDVWDVALRKYGSFPIFTRRYPSQGVENFAFDSLLGKPCIVVVHHEYFRDHGIQLIEFIERINALNCRLSWRSLGDVVRRSYRQLELSSRELRIEMYGSELRLENCTDEERRFLVMRRESDMSGIKEIRTSSRNVPWSCSEHRINFEIRLAPGQIETACVSSVDSPIDARCQESSGYKLKTMLRRYLSEMRDNYVSTRWT